MGNDGTKGRQSATESSPRPGEFPLGSEKSRAAARAVLSAREAETQECQVFFLLSAGQQEDLELDLCTQILRECVKLPHGPGPFGLVDLTSIPFGLNVEELKKFIREHDMTGRARIRTG